MDLQDAEKGNALESLNDQKGNGVEFLENVTLKGNQIPQNLNEATSSPTPPATTAANEIQQTPPDFITIDKIMKKIDEIRNSILEDEDDEEWK